MKTPIIGGFELVEPLLYSRVHTMSRGAIILKNNKTTHVCHVCVREEYLSSLVHEEGQSRTCSYCGKKRKSVSIIIFSDHIEGAFKRHYERTADEPDLYQSIMMRDDDSTYDWERSGYRIDEAIADAACVSFEIASDVQVELESRHYDHDDWGECEFSIDSHYEERTIDDTKWQNEWQTMDYSLRNEARLYNLKVTDTLTKLFHGIGSINSNGSNPALITVSPLENEFRLFRARAFSRRDDVIKALENPEKELGPPPSQFSASGRMNSTGISIFYGAIEPETAIAEVRPYVGSSVVTAQFHLTRTLTLLDLNALAMTYSERSSIFDSAYSEKLAHHSFLRGLEDRLIIPVAPEKENQNYILTQTIADFLASHEAGIDGIIFKSTQTTTSAQNIALFHKSSKVKSAPLKRCRNVYEIEEDHEDPNSDFSYNVREEEVDNKDKADKLALSRFIPQIDDDREDSLKIDLNSIVVHEIRGVEFKCNSRLLKR